MFKIAEARSFERLHYAICGIRMGSGDFEDDRDEQESVGRRRGNDSFTRARQYSSNIMVRAAQEEGSRNGKEASQ